MKKLLAILLFSGLFAHAQTHTFPALDTNNTFTGTNTFNSTVSVQGTLGVKGPLTFNTLGLNPSTGIPLLQGKNTSLTAQQAGFPAETPIFEQYLENNSNDFYANPMIYLSRFDSTAYVAPGGTPGIGSCFNNGPLASCDQPMLLIAGTNQTTGSIPGMTGVECNLWGFAANGAAPPIFADYEVCFGANLSDQAVANITNLTAGNFTYTLFGNPAQTGPGGFNRHGNGLEIDANNSTGNPAVFTTSGGIGNVIDGMTVVALGANNSTTAIGINSSASVSGKGWIDGIEIGGITVCGLCIYTGGPGVFSPTTAVHISDSGTNGLVIGSGTIDEAKSTASNSAGNPTNGLVIDSQGTAGVSETQNSNTIIINAKTASVSPTKWTIQQIGSTNNLNFTLSTGGSFSLSGNTALYTATSPQFQLAGGTTSGRLLSDATGIAITADTAAKTVRFATNNGSLHNWLSVGQNGEISLGATPTLLIANTAPTIAVGGCGGAAATIATNNGTAAFTINVGTTPTAAGCVVTLPTATNGWNCFATDITTNSTSVDHIKQTAAGSSTTAATLVNYSNVSVATAPTASDIWQVSCFAR